MNIEDGTELIDRLKDTVHEQFFEIKRLRELEKEHQKINGELRKEIEKKNEIIKKLKEK